MMGNMCSPKNSSRSPCSSRGAVFSVAFGMAPERSGAGAGAGAGAVPKGLEIYACMYTASKSELILA